MSYLFELKCADGLASVAVDRELNLEFLDYDVEYDLAEAEIGEKPSKCVEFLNEWDRERPLRALLLYAVPGNVSARVVLEMMKKTEEMFGKVIKHHRKWYRPSAYFTNLYALRKSVREMLELITVSIVNKNRTAAHHAQIMALSDKMFTQRSQLDLIEPRSRIPFLKIGVDELVDSIDELSTHTDIPRRPMKGYGQIVYGLLLMTASAVSSFAAAQESRIGEIATERKEKALEHLMYREIQKQIGMATDVLFDLLEEQG